MAGPGHSIHATAVDPELSTGPKLLVQSTAVDPIWATLLWGPSVRCGSPAHDGGPPISTCESTAVD